MLNIPRCGLDLCPFHRAHKTNDCTQTTVPTHLTALMCSQEAVPAMGPFCSLVRPCTVSS